MSHQWDRGPTERNSPARSHAGRPRRIDRGARLRHKPSMAHSLLRWTSLDGGAGSTTDPRPAVALGHRSGAGATRVRARLQAKGEMPGDRAGFPPKRERDALTSGQSRVSPVHPEATACGRDRGECVDWRLLLRGHLPARVGEVLVDDAPAAFDAGQREEGDEGQRAPESVLDHGCAGCVAGLNDRGDPRPERLAARRVSHESLMYSVIGSS
jgi:hypothetical protein